MKRWCAHSDGEKSPRKETAVGTFLPDRWYENGLAQVWQSVSQIGANRPHRTQLTVAEILDIVCCSWPVVVTTCALP